jgi:hypothetical protein
MFNKENAVRVINKKTQKGSSYKTFVFKCSECDNEIMMQIHNLKTHSGKCRRCVQYKKPYEHILNELIYRCKNYGNDKKITITYDEFIEIIEESKCHYCDRELQYSKYTRDSDSKYTSRAHQLDRKNNSKGYTKENVVTCCWDCNRIKSDIYTYEEFMKLSVVLKQIYKERQSK